MRPHLLPFQTYRPLLLLLLLGRCLSCHASCVALFHLTVWLADMTLRLRVCTESLRRAGASCRKAMLEARHMLDRPNRRRRPLALDRIMPSTPLCPARLLRVGLAWLRRRSHRSLNNSSRLRRRRRHHHLPTRCRNPLRRPSSSRVRSLQLRPRTQATSRPPLSMVCTANVLPCSCKDYQPPCAPFAPFTDIIDIHYLGPCAIFVSAADAWLPNGPRSFSLPSIILLS